MNTVYGGNILNKTPEEAFEMFSELSEGSRQFSKRTTSRSGNVVSSESSLKFEVIELKDIMR